MKSTSLSFVIALAALAVSAAVACTSSTSASGDSDAGTGKDASTLDGGGGDSATTDGGGDGGGGLYPDGVTKIVVTSKGGFTAGAPDGSTCQPADVTYTLTPATRELAWKICEQADGSAVFAFRTGQKTLTAEQYKDVDDAIHALKRQTQKQCGADAPSEQITFTTASGDVTYYDDFYFCDENDTKIFVIGLGDVFAAIAPLAE